MAQRDDQIERAGLTRPERLWAHITWFTLGYGYQPWRALLLLLATVGAGVAFTLLFASHGALAHVSTTPASDCSTLERIGVGLDLGTPLLTTGAREVCQPTETAAGTTLTIGGWLLQLLAWGFATLFVAGFTGAVRKT
ncbi:hypothetical protein ACQP1P_32400 [Dactylosporangium sp. CA-052675]|uniref:hypothetical protein n=1 Tax=Dactylosporangium sp. CA-052675 TaxID=3239927 RepID=UPI003D8A552F